MRLTDDRIRQIADGIVDVLYDDELIEYSGRLEALTVKIEKVIMDYLALGDRISEEAAEQLKTYSRDIVAGTAEWMILHEKHMADLALKYNYVLH